MRNYLLLFMLFFTVSIFAQEVVETVDTSFDAVKSLFLPAIFASLLVLFAEAKKYFFTDEWDFKVFLSTNIIPFLLTNGIAVVLYFLIAYLPFSKPFIEILAGSAITELTAGALIGTATAIVKGLLKPRVTEEQPVFEER